MLLFVYLLFLFICRAWTQCRDSKKVWHEEKGKGIMLLQENIQTQN